MSARKILEEKVKNLPEPLTQEVEDFIDFVVMKYKRSSFLVDKDKEAIRHALKGSVLKYDDPFSSVVDLLEWEANQ